MARLHTRDLIILLLLENNHSRFSYYSALVSVLCVEQGSGIYQICISLMSPVCPLLHYLISEGPGCPHTLLDVLDQTVAALCMEISCQTFMIF